MTPVASVLLVLAAAFGAGTWVAISAGFQRLEYACKPAAMAALVAMALTLHAHSNAQRALFVAALLLGLAGDVFLMLPRDYLIAGLVSFLLGHLAYIAGFRFLTFAAVPAAAATAFVVVGAALMLRRYIAGL